MDIYLFDHKQMCRAAKIINHHIRILVYTFCFYIVSISAFSQTTYQNFSIASNYHVTDMVRLEYRVVDLDSVYSVNFSLYKSSSVDFEENYSIQCEIKKSYLDESSIEISTINYPVHGQGETDSEFFYKFSVKKEIDYNLILLRIKNKITNEVQIYNIPLQGPAVFQPADFSLISLPDSLTITNSFIHDKTEFFISPTNNQVNEFFIYRYSDVFLPADPPMYRIKKKVSKDLSLDSLFPVNQKQIISLKKPGLYFIQSDTSGLTGIGVRSELSQFPKLGQFEQLISPLIYLTTEQEINKINSASNKREAFEKFWLTLTKSEERARKMIKAYYDRIEEANKLFTGYKPGWQTDMGMIYIIYGPPDEAYRNGQTEVWHYNRLKSSQNAIVFNFLYIKNIFSQNHFMLIRDPKYKQDWFRAIENWRKGLI